MGPVLLFDMPYLAHRAFHALPTLTSGDVSTGVVWGVLRDVVLVQEMFTSSRCVFCFEGGRPYRTRLLPTYKSARRVKREQATDGEKAARACLQEQVRWLGAELLPGAGYHNVLRVPGYEADDLMAAQAGALDPGDEAVIVSSDNDLLQCLAENVSIYRPQTRKTISVKTFQEAWGLDPVQWADVKALAGCSTDDIPGVQGVGEITAAKYLRGDLATTTAAYKKIQAGISDGVYDRNINLVRLPYTGCPVATLQQDTVTLESWEALATTLAAPSLMQFLPYGVKGKSRGRKR